MRKLLGKKTEVKAEPVDLSNEQMNLKQALKVARNLEDLRVRRIDNRINTDSKFPDGEPSLLLRSRSKFNRIKLFRNTRVKLGLLQPTDESISFTESAFPSAADQQAAYNRLKIAAKHAQTLSVEPEKLENESAQHLDKALEGYDKHEQDRVDAGLRLIKLPTLSEAWNSFKVAPAEALKEGFKAIAKASAKVGVAQFEQVVAGKPTQKYIEAFKNANLFRNTKMKLFGYNPADKTMSYFEALTKKRDTLAVENKTQFEVRLKRDAFLRAQNMRNEHLFER